MPILEDDFLKKPIKYRLSNDYKPTKFGAWVTQWGFLFDAIVGICTFCLVQTNVSLSLVVWNSKRELRRQRTYRMEVITDD